MGVKCVVWFVVGTPFGSGCTALMIGELTGRCVTTSFAGLLDGTVNAFATSLVDAILGSEGARRRSFCFFAARVSSPFEDGSRARFLRGVFGEVE